MLRTVPGTATGGAEGAAGAAAGGAEGATGAAATAPPPCGRAGGGSTSIASSRPRTITLGGAGTAGGVGEGLSSESPLGAAAMSCGIPFSTKAPGARRPRGARGGKPLPSFALVSSAMATASGASPAPIGLVLRTVPGTETAGAAGTALATAGAGLGAAAAGAAGSGAGAAGAGAGAGAGLGISLGCAAAVLAGAWNAQSAG